MVTKNKNNTTFIFFYCAERCVFLLVQNILRLHQRVQLHRNIGEVFGYARFAVKKKTNWKKKIGSKEKDKKDLAERRGEKQRKRHHETAFILHRSLYAHSIIYEQYFFGLKAA